MAAACGRRLRAPNKQTNILSETGGSAAPPNGKAQCGRVPLQPARARASAAPVAHTLVVAGRLWMEDAIAAAAAGTPVQAHPWEYGSNLHAAVRMPQAFATTHPALPPSLPPFSRPPACPSISPAPARALVVLALPFKRVCSTGAHRTARRGWPPRRAHVFLTRQRPCHLPLRLVSGAAALGQRLGVTSACSVGISGRRSAASPRACAAGAVRV